MAAILTAGCYRVWTIGGLVSSSFTVKQEKEEEEEEVVPNNVIVEACFWGLKCFKAKVHTGLTQDRGEQQQQQQQLWRFSSTAWSTGAWDSYCRLNWLFIYTLIIHSVCQTSTWARHEKRNTTSDRYSARARYYYFYMWTAKLSCNYESTACCTHLWCVKKKKYHGKSQ